MERGNVRPVAAVDDLATALRATLFGPQVLLHDALTLLRLVANFFKGSSAPGPILERVGTQVHTVDRALRNLTLYTAKQDYEALLRLIFSDNPALISALWLAGPAPLHQLDEGRWTGYGEMLLSTWTTARMTFYEAVQRWKNLGAEDPLIRTSLAQDDATRQVQMSILTRALLRVEW